LNFELLRGLERLERLERFPGIAFSIANLVIANLSKTAKVKT
jgi:hypothetical protein